MMHAGALAPLPSLPWNLVSSDFDALLDKLRKIAALHAGATSPGEADAAARALQRVQAQLDLARASAGPNAAPAGQPAAERVGRWQFSMPDPWKRKLFLALCRQRGLEPYRQYRQRYSTVMVRATESMVNNDLWPTYLALEEQLDKYLQDVTLKVIQDVLHQRDEEAPEVDERLLPGEADE